MLHRSRGFPVFAPSPSQNGKTIQNTGFTTECPPLLSLIYCHVSPPMTFGPMIYASQLKCQCVSSCACVPFHDKLNYAETRVVRRRIIYASCHLTFPVTSLICLRLSLSSLLSSLEQVRKGKSYGAARVVPLPRHSATSPRARPLSTPIIAAPTSEVLCPGPDGKDAAPVPAARQDPPDGALQLRIGDVSTASGTEALSRSVTLGKMSSAGLAAVSLHNSFNLIPMWNVHKRLPAQHAIGKHIYLFWVSSPFIGKPFIFAQ